MKHIKKMEWIFISIVLFLWFSTLPEKEYIFILYKKGTSEWYLISVSRGVHSQTNKPLTFFHSICKNIKSIRNQSYTNHLLCQHTSAKQPCKNPSLLRSLLPVPLKHDIVQMSKMYIDFWKFSTSHSKLCPQLDIFGTLKTVTVLQK